MRLQRNSPHIKFGDLLALLKRGDFYNCRNYFPIGFCRNNSRRIYWPSRPGQLKGKELWWCWPHPLGYRSLNNLTELKSNIYSELVDPLFLKISINIKDEDNASKHKNDNLICCLEVYLNKLKQVEEYAFDKFDKILNEFQFYYGNITSRINKKAKVDPLFSWIRELDENIGITLDQLDKDRDQLEINKLDLEKKMNEVDFSAVDSDEIMSSLFKEWRQCLNSLQEKKIKIEAFKNERIAKIEYIESKLRWLKTARGRPGRHPKPFNVLSYHLINKYTSWKFDWRKRRLGKKEPYIYRKNGQHKLKRDWSLIIYLLLDIHLFSKELPEIQRFINKHGKKPANKALGALKNMLWNSYKNFPPKEGRPLPRKTQETGYRKLIVNNDGRLQIVRL